LADHPSAAAYAAFRAATDQTGVGWHAWGAGAARLPVGVETDGDQARFHHYVPWTMHRQLTGVAADLSTRDQRLYLDLPVGTHGDGFDTWSAPELFAWGCGVGAPPDDFFGEGQNWGFPPVNPFAGREQGHQQLAACLRHHMSVAGVLRLDHVMGFERLYWVPNGAHARDGVYVRYPRDELFAVLAVESSRSGCRVVGEDLGTVPDEVREALGRHGLLGMYVSQFRLPGPGESIPAPTDHQVAGIDTHDTPTLRGWLEGLDIGIRHGMGLLDDAQTAAAHDQRRHDIAQLRAALVDAGHLRDGDDVLVGLLRSLGASPAASVLVEVDDLLDETEPQNVPGTTLDRPNWVHKLRLSIPQLEDDPAVRAALDALQAARLSAYQSALEAAS
jgi:4-alpha-glucanotransferase